MDTRCAIRYNQKQHKSMTIDRQYHLTVVYYLTTSVKNKYSTGGLKQ